MKMPPRTRRSKITIETMFDDGTQTDDPFCIVCYGEHDMRLECCKKNICVCCLVRWVQNAPVGNCPHCRGSFHNPYEVLEIEEDDEEEIIHEDLTDLIEAAVIRVTATISPNEISDPN